MERGESWGDDCVVKLNYEDSRTRYVYLLTPTAMMQMTCVHSRYNTGMYTVGAWIAGWSEPAVLNDGRVDICLYCGMVNLSIVCPIPWSYTLVSHFSPPFLEAGEQFTTCPIPRVGLLCTGARVHKNERLVRVRACNYVKFRNWLEFTANTVTRATRNDCC